jgi:preprotein translocase subunit YajC
MHTQIPRKIERIMEHLDEDQLQLLCDKAWERLQFLRRKEDLHRLSRFSVGDKVIFSARGQLITGTIIRINQRTVTLRTKHNREWRVSPHLLSPLMETEEAMPLDVAG